ncbi:MAG: OmpA family protein [candidate division NC10 bacterium]|nr:OmpA family protein [candidate division NC10 bacterium]
MLIRSSIRALVLLLGVGVLVAGCVARSTFEAKEQEAARTMSELEAARAAGRSLAAELETVKTARAALERERAGLQRDLETTRAMIQAANKRIGELEQTIANHEAEIGRLQKVTTEKEQEIARLRTTYDSLVRDLKKEIEAGDIKVTQFRDLLTVNLVEKILFDSGRAEIKPRGLEILKRVGDILKGVPDKVVRIEGHTDNVPIGAALRARFPTNWELSTARATVVARFLQDKVGLDPTRLSATGYGEYRPVAPNDSEEGRAQNRRIEIILAPLPPATAAGG